MYCPQNSIERRATLSAATLIVAATVMAAPPGVASGDTRDLNIDPMVASVTLAPPENPYFPPIIVLGSDQRLTMSFDLLDYDVHYLRYSVTHCDAMWNPTTSLVESEWVDGFNMADIEDWVQCEATFTHYFNYSFDIPNDRLRITKSGNYVVSVYEQDDPEHVIVQRRFSVCENIASARLDVTSRTDIDYNDGHQQLTIDVTSRPGTIADPYRDLTLVISQNNRDATSAVVTAPTMVAPDKVTYEHRPELIFEAGNEYRRFETVSAHTLNMGVERWEYFDPYYHVTLRQDKPRRSSQYLYDQTQHGHFTIRNADTNREDACFTADYALTHFTLDTGGPVTGGSIHIDGELTRGLSPAATRLNYDASTGCYHGTLLLKQGAYNYQYVYRPDGTGDTLAAPIEGNKYQTSNEYLVKVYYHPSGERYDRMIAFGIITSGR